MTISSVTTQVYCLSSPTGEIGWFPPIDEDIKCINSCEYIASVVEIDENVIYQCGTEFCVFNCQLNANVNINQATGSTLFQSTLWANRANLTCP